MSILKGLTHKWFQSQIIDTCACYVLTVKLIKMLMLLNFSGVMKKLLFPAKALAIITLLLPKVEKMFKGRLYLIASLSHSVKIQIMGGKVCLRC